MRQGETGETLFLFPLVGRLSRPHCAQSQGHRLRDGVRPSRKRRRSQQAAGIPCGEPADARAGIGDPDRRRADPVARHHRISRRDAPRAAAPAEGTDSAGQARALAQIVACDIHPLNNVGPLRYLKNQMHQEQSAIDAWYHHWVIAGFEAYEALVLPGPYSCGGEVTMADICLVPQVYNARRLKVPLDHSPKSSASTPPASNFRPLTAPARKTSRMRSNQPFVFFTLWSPFHRLIG